MNVKAYPTTAGILDRTGLLLAFVPVALDRLRIDLELVDLGSAADLGPSTPRVQLLLLGPKELSAATLRKVDRFCSAHPGAVVVAAGVATEGASRAELRSHGIHFAVRGALTPAKLSTAISRAYAELLEIAEATFGVLDDSLREIDPEVDEPRFDAQEEVPEFGLEGDGTQGAVPVVSAMAGDAEPSTERSAIVLTVASATGGCGKTFFATNLAALLAKAGHRCLLVDMDLQFGEVAAALRVRHPYSVYDGLYDGAGRALPRADMSEHLDRLVYHHSLGFDVLTAPRDPSLADYVGAKDATTVLDAVTPVYEVVVVDTPPSLNEVVLTVLDRSDVVAVLATLDVPSLKNLTVFLDTLRRLRLDDARMRLILNKVEDDIGISVAQAQEAFADGFVATIPLARAVSRAINAGTVVVEMEPRSQVSRQMTAAVSAVLPMAMAVATASVAQTTPWWSRLVRRLSGRRAVAGNVGGHS